MLYVVDEVMGSGKTTAAIRFICLSLLESQKVIYVTPYLSEVNRIMEETGLITQQSEPKIYEFRRQLESGCSVVITHALFSLLNDQDAREIQRRGYIMIMDEAPGVISPLDISPYDLDILWSRLLKDGERGQVLWNQPDYAGVFSDIKAIAESGNLYRYAGGGLFSMTPPSIYRAFKDVYILTYMFDAQLIRCYFDYHGMEYRRKTLEQMPDRRDFRELINIVDDFGNYPGKFDLSRSWYSRASAEDLDKLKHNTENFFRNKPTIWSPASGKFARAKSGDVLWTTFVDFQSALSGKGYTKGFAPCNMRASNSYAARRAVAYLINRFMNPNIKNFFLYNGVAVDDDGFALSEMLQFIWRSAVRNGERISIYIPSLRMRSLLRGWLDNLT